MPTIYAKLRNIPTGVGRRGGVTFRVRALPEHPHARGEKPGQRERARRAGGTSPRAWGEAERENRVGEAERNIPTGVGRRLKLRAILDWVPKRFGIPHPLDRV